MYQDEYTSDPRQANVIKVENLWFRFPSSERWILKGINLEVRRGDFFVLTGPSGAGKSVLTLCFNGIIPNNKGGAFKGKVLIDGVDTTKTTVANLAQKVGMVFQDPESQFIGMTVEEDVVFGLENLCFSREVMRDRLEWALGVVRMKGYENKTPYELSGGQKQRVAIAAALVLKPEILVLDEPTAELDPIGKREVLDVVSELNMKYGITIFLVTHETEEVAEYATKMSYMDDGKIQRIAQPTEFFEDVEYLKENGVRIPQVTELTKLLALDGFTSSRLPIVLDDAIDLYRKILRGAVDG